MIKFGRRITSRVLSSIDKTLPRSYTMELSRQELQKAVTATMPITRKVFLVLLTVSNPEIILANGDTRLGILFDLTAAFPFGIMLRRSIHVHGSLSYEPEEATFYFADIEIADIRSQHAPHRRHGILKKLAVIAVRKSLSRYPVYRLDDSSLKHKFARGMMKSLHIEDGRIFLVLGV